MELGLVFAYTINLWASVDQLVRFGLEPFEEVESFLVAKDAMVCPKCFDSAKGISFPHDVIGGHVSDQFGCRFFKIDGECSKMLGVGVRPAFASAIAFGICDMILHSLLEELLGATNVGFSGCLALNSINNNWVTAVVVVGAAFLLTVLAVAFSGLEVLGYDICVDLGSDITIEDFTKVTELVVGHGDTKPMQTILLLEVLDNEPYGYGPCSRHANAKVSCSTGISFALLLGPFGG